MKPTLQPYQKEILGSFISIDTPKDNFTLDSLEELFERLRKECSICGQKFPDFQLFEYNNEYNCINCWERLNEMSPQKSPRPKTISELEFENDIKNENPNDLIYYDSSLTDALVRNKKP